MQLPLVNLLGEAVFRINDKVNNAAMLGGTHDSSNLCSKKDGGWWFQKGKKLGERRMCSTDVILAVAS